MTVKNGYWLATDVVAAQELNLMPRQVVVQFTGATPVTWTTDWFRRQNFLLDPGWPWLATGNDIGAYCQAVGQAKVVSTGGHVAVVTTPDRERLCVGGTITKSVVAEGGFGLTRAAPPPGVNADVLVAGGVMTDGVTSIVYHTPAGDIPAMIADGYWCVEYLRVGRTEAAPTSMRVSVTKDGAVQQISVPVQGA